MHKCSCSHLIHKRNAIALFIETFSCNLDRYLSDLLSPLIPSEYSFKDTFSFVSQIKRANLIGKCVSYYVTGVFNNIPL